MAEYFKKDGDKFVEVDEKLLPQEEVDKVVESRLERQKKQYADYDDLKEKAGKVDSIASEFTEKLKAKDTEIDTYKGDLGKAKLETTKVKVMHEFKLSDELAEFINGADEDTIRSQAEKLQKGLPGSSVIIDKNPKPGDNKTSDVKTAAQGLFGKKSGD